MVPEFVPKNEVSIHLSKTADLHSSRHDFEGLAERLVFTQGDSASANTCK